MIEDISQCSGAKTDQVACLEFLIQVFFGKAKKAKVEIGAAVFALPDGLVLAIRWPLLR